MAEFVTDNDGGGGDGSFGLGFGLDHFLIPKPEPVDEDEGNQHQYQHPAGFNLDFDLEATVRSLVTRVGALEKQIATCLESQPLLYRIFDKVNVLEQRLKKSNRNSGVQLRTRTRSDDQEEKNWTTDTDSSDNDPPPSGMEYEESEPEANHFEMDIKDINHDHDPDHGDKEEEDNQDKKRKYKPKDPDWVDSKEESDSIKNAKVPTSPTRTRRRRPKESQPAAPCTCSICSKTVDRRHLKEHEFYHRFKAAAEAPPTEARPRYRSRVGRRYVYSFCIEPGCKFNSKGRRRGLQETYHHYMHKHPESDILWAYVCEVCPPDPNNGLRTRFTTQSRLDHHCAKKHPVGPPPPKPKRPKPDVVWICEECGKQFQYKGTLKKHKGIHERSRNSNSNDQIHAADNDPGLKPCAPSTSTDYHEATPIANPTEDCTAPPFQFEFGLSSINNVSY